MSGAPLPIFFDGVQYQVDLSIDEREMICRLVAEMRDLVTDTEPNDETRSLVDRLFPVTHPDDAEAEAEYQRLMRSELVESKRVACDTVINLLDTKNGKSALDEGEMTALMQSINSVRLVLGTMLQVSDDPDAPEVMPGFENSREYHLYGYLSWLLECTVRALTGEWEEDDGLEGGPRQQT